MTDLARMSQQWEGFGKLLWEELIYKELFKFHPPSPKQNKFRLWFSTAGHHKSSQTPGGGVGGKALQFVACCIFPLRVGLSSQKQSQHSLGVCEMGMMHTV